MAYEKGKPEPGIKAKLLDDRVRGNNDFIQPAINNDHDFTDAVASEQSGKHKTLHMMEQSAPGASASDEGNLAVIDSGGQPELSFTSEDGVANVITKAGGLNAATTLDVGTDATIGGNAAITGDTTTATLDIGATVVVVGTIDDDTMAEATDTTIATSESVKAYQDNVVGNEADGQASPVTTGYQVYDVEGSPTKVYTKYLMGVIGVNSPFSIAHGVDGSANILDVSVIMESDGGDYALTDRGTVPTSSLQRWQADFDGTNITFSSVGSELLGAANKYRIKIEYIA